jgi:hypothetical protein
MATPWVKKRVAHFAALKARHINLKLFSPQ